jgi:voltage-gated potassium channel
VIATGAKPTDQSLLLRSTGSRISANAIELALQWAVVVAALTTIPLILEEEQSNPSRGLVVADWVIWLVFLADYVVMAALAVDRRKYVRQNYLGLAVVVISFPLLPPLLGLVRLARLVRVLRFARLVVVASRGLPALRATLGRRGFLYVISVTALLVLVAGAFMSAIEPETVKGGFGAGVWWAIATVTTIGYGDISPATPLGRVAATLLMLAGIGLASTLAAAVAAHFVHEDQGAELKAIIARLDRIEDLLSAHAGTLPDGAPLIPPQRPPAQQAPPPTCQGS